MATLEVRYFTGDVVRHDLHRHQPLSIGRHLSSDIRIDEDEVAVLHARVSWNKQAYEVLSAGADGVEVNGTLVRQAVLNDGDVLRIGSVDLIFRGEAASGSRGSSRAGGAQPASAPSLPPVPGAGHDLPTYGLNVSPEAELDEEPPEPRHRPAAPLGPPVLPEPPRPAEKATPNRPQLPAVPAGYIAPDSIEIPSSAAAELPRSPHEDEEDGDGEASADKSRKSKKKSKKSGGPSLVARVRETLKGRPVRPGEQDALRSPFVLTLGGGAALLALAGLIFWFMMGREASQRMFDEARDEFVQGKFVHATALFESFIQQHPRHKDAEQAKLFIGRAKVEQEISGASPNWQAGLAAMHEYLKQTRDRPDQAALQPDIRDLCERLALGSLKTIETQKVRDLLPTADEAATLAERFPPADRDPAEFTRQFQDARRKAEAALVKHETLVAAGDAIELALGKKQALTALAERRKLLLTYPDLLTEKRLVAQLMQMLAQEQTLVVREDEPRDAARDEFPSEVAGTLTPTPLTRAVTGDASDGRTAIAVAKDTCYGVDTVTGQPLWRRVIGLDAPFFPRVLPTRIPSALWCDTRRGQLVAVELRTGKLLWRQSLAAPASGAPLLHEGQLYVVTTGRELIRFDADSGQSTARLRFPQGLVAPPVLCDGGERVVVFGQREVAYTLQLRPLECTHVTLTGHADGALEAAPVGMGTLVMSIENDRLANSLLRVWNATEPDRGIKEVGSARVEGTVRQTPVLRGRELYVPSSAERVTAFMVSDEPGEKPLAEAARATASASYSGPLHIVAGPDSQLWLAGSALRKFQLKGDNLQLDPKSLAAGVATQPLQHVGTRLFAGRRPLHGGGVIFSDADPDAMETRWRLTLGAGVAGALLIPGAPGAESLVVVNENGELHRFTPAEWNGGGFRLAAAGELKLPPGLAEPLRSARLGANQLAVWCGGSQPKLWIVNSTAGVERQVDLEQPLEAAPLAVGAGYVLPQAGRLKWHAISGGAVEDWVAPAGKGPTPAWRQLIAIDDGQFVALTSTGQLLRFQVRNEPVPHLAEVARLALLKPVDVGLAFAAGKLYLARSDQTLQALSASSFESLSELKLPQPATGDLWLAGDRLYVETGRQQLRAIELGPPFKLLWTVPVPSPGLAGAPLETPAGVVVALRHGRLLRLDRATGATQREVDVQQPLTHGPLWFGQNPQQPAIIVPAVDGSLLRVEAIFTPAPK